MKKIFAILSVLVLLFSFTACKKDYLETSPTDRVAGPTIFSDAENAMTAANGLIRLLFVGGWGSSWGAGRWAKKRSLPRTAGHAVGAETVRTIANYCKDIGIDYLTLYAFSTENWKRPDDEVKTLMNLFEQYVAEAIGVIQRDNIRMDFFGDLEGLSPKLQEMMATARRESAGHAGCQLNLCINYGGRDEILHAVRRYAEDYAAGKAPELTEESFGRLLYTGGLPDPDLIIRTSGEQRLSNFLPWQAAYSELYFTPVFWPDFTPRDMDAAIIEFQRRNRRFGGI